MARYQLEERIGVGGMAEVFRGTATAGGGFEKPVAIKRILPHLSQDKRFVALLITEAKTLSQLRHRNVVQIYDVGLGDDGQYFLVMEYVDGIDLGHLYVSLEKRSRRLPLDVALYIVGEVCEALEHAHQARGEDGQPLGLVHRDVSPSNVLLSRSGEVKLTDFGIAKRTEESTGHGGVRGKFAYISPEQAHNRRVDARSDVYSIGILLFELVTGHRLFSDLPDFDALRAVREGRLPRPRDIDPSIDGELERILLTGLAPRPEDRFPSAGALGAQLRSCRYALLSSIGDPAVEIARLVDEHTGKEHKPSTRQPSVVRINTVAGFSGSFEVPEESSGGGDTGEIGRLPLRSLVMDDEEETRSVNLSSVAALLESSSDADQDLEMADAGDQHASSALALAEAETRVVGYGATERYPELAEPSAEAPAVEPISHTESPGPHEAPPGPDADDDTQVRAATPTIRQAFYAGAMLDDARGPDPAPPAAALLDKGTASGGRAVLLTFAALILAVLSFLIAGAFMNSGRRTGAAQTPPGPADAAPSPVDAAAPPVPLEAQSVSDETERPKHKKKKPVKKRTAKPAVDKKRGTVSKQ